MLIMFMLCWSIISSINGAVLDPALYMSPLPPLVKSSHDISPGELWSLTVNDREHRNSESLLNQRTIEENSPTNDKEEEEAMDKAETFWPSFRTTDYGTSEIQVPLTFTLTGTYGNKGPGMGIVSTRYASLPGVSGYRSSGLAGSSYGTYGSTFPRERIYGGDRVFGWSGWGNGKWGHYGKG